MAANWTRAGARESQSSRARRIVSSIHESSPPSADACMCSGRARKLHLGRTAAHFSRPHRPRAFRDREGYGLRGLLPGFRRRHRHPPRRHRHPLPQPGNPSDQAAGPGPVQLPLLHLPGCRLCPPGQAVRPSKQRSSKQTDAGGRGRGRRRRLGLLLSRRLAQAGAAAAKLGLSATRVPSSVPRSWGR